MFQTLARRRMLRHRYQQQNLDRRIISSWTSSSSLVVPQQESSSSLGSSSPATTLNHYRPSPQLVSYHSSTRSTSTSSSLLLVERQTQLNHHSFRSFSTAATVDDNDNDDNDDDNVSKQPNEAFTLTRRKGMRCIAIVAHVDHGKTSLVDCLLKASKKKNNGNNNNDNDNETDRLMDSGDLERERGITITSKVTRVHYNHDNNNDNTDNNDNNNIIINIADSPGHADFSAEVDRILSVTDGFLLVVDVVEGPKSQTKYVLSRALNLGLNPVVVLNKCDRPEAAAKIDSGETETAILDLFVALDATDDQLEYKTLYASAREGWVTEDPLQALELAAEVAAGEEKRIIPDDCQMSFLLDTIVEEIPEPSVRIYDDDGDGEKKAAATPSLSASAFENDKFSLAAVSVGFDAFLGRTCSGRITSGSIGINDKVTVLPRAMLEVENGVDENTGEPIRPSESNNVSGVFVYKGTQRVALMDDDGNAAGKNARAAAGDYVTLAGVPDSIAVGDTVTSTTNPVPLPIETLPLAPPTLSMDFGANDGPLSGKEGTLLASSQVRDRLVSETDNNVTLKVENHPEETEKTVVYARGELQLGILAEQMRREGFEMIISPPRILTKECAETGKTLEPYEEVTVDVDSEYTGGVVNLMTGGERNGTLLEMTNDGVSDGKSQLIFEMPSRGMLGGFRSELATATRGSAVVNHIFIGDREQVGPATSLDQKGKLVSTEMGKASGYALASLEARGTLFVAPGDEVYPGMVIGENAKPGDLEVNPIRAKEKTNMRTQAKDEKVALAPPKRMSVEELIAYMSPDEMIEVTPQNVRLRKQLLDSGARERANRAKAKQIRALKEQKRG